MSDLDDVIETAEIESVTFDPDAPDAPDAWVPARTRLKPQFSGDLLPVDPDCEFDERETMRFFTELAEGYGPMMIGLSMGWTPAKVNRFTTEKSRAEIIEMITESVHESVEHAIMVAARSQNSTGMKLWAFNKMPHRGWADRREVHTQVSGQAEIIHSVRIAMLEQTQKMVGAGGRDAVKTLQAAFLDADDDVIDAEVVEES